MRSMTSVSSWFVLLLFAGLPELSLEVQYKPSPGTRHRLCILHDLFAHCCISINRDVEG